MFTCLRHFARIKDDTHIVLHIFNNLIKALEKEYKNHFSNAEHVQQIYKDLESVQKILYNPDDLFKPEYYALWNLDLRQGRRVLKSIETKNPYTTQLCSNLKRGWEPLQTVTENGFEDHEVEHRIEEPKAMVL